MSKNANEPDGSVAVEEEGKLPTLLEGQRVKVVGGPFIGRMAYVIDHIFHEVQDWINFHNPNPYRNTAHVDGYVVKSRDSRNETFEVTPEQVVALDDTQGWGRGEAPEVIPGDEKDLAEKAAARLADAKAAQAAEPEAEPEAAVA